jgi:hypothetical protein
MQSFPTNVVAAISYCALIFFSADILIFFEIDRKEIISSRSMVLYVPGMFLFLEGKKKIINSIDFGAMTQSCKE